MKLISGVSMILFIWIVSCTTEESSTTPFPIAKPEHFPPILYNLESNPLTQEGFKLGRKLFNDPILSSDGSVACSNCHVKQAAFTDPQ
ncbi:MAG: cytochrome c peroxidase, partial [Saprospiraceae bacterium]